MTEKGNTKQYDLEDQAYAFAKELTPMFGAIITESEQQAFRSFSNLAIWICLGFRN